MATMLHDPMFWVLTGFAVAVLVLSVIKTRWDNWKERVERGGLCPDCGYDIRHNKDRCPECGRSVADREALYWW
jgi:predicted amidophosphoribosyltransferase